VTRFVVRLAVSMAHLRHGGEMVKCGRSSGAGMRKAVVTAVAKRPTLRSGVAGGDKACRNQYRRPKLKRHAERGSGQAYRANEIVLSSGISRPGENYKYGSGEHSAGGGEW